MRNSIILVLLFCSPLSAEVFSVGADGSHATVQAAIDAAAMSTTENEIRIAAGSFTENLRIEPNGAGIILEISGGWNASFNARDGMSVIDGDMIDQVVRISMNGSDNLSLHHLTFRNGFRGRGAGLEITQDGSSVLRIEDCEVSNNVAESERSEGGGLLVSVNEESRFELRGTLITDNESLCSGTVDCRTGGLGIQTSGNGQATVTSSVISNNRVMIASGSGFAAGVLINMFDEGNLIFNDNQITGNTVSAPTSSGGSVGLSIFASGPVIARRNTIQNNTAEVDLSTSVSQASFFQFGSHTSILSDTLIADGNGKGIVAGASGSGAPSIHLTNLTVANHIGIGVQITSIGETGTAFLSNSIIVSNGTNTLLDETVSSEHNLQTGSGGFVDAAAGNFSLGAGSGAIDGGSSTAVDAFNLPCSHSDIRGLGRAQDGNGDGIFECDMGAFEFQAGEDIAAPQSAAYFDAARSGEGAFVEIIDGGLAVVSYYTYTQDGSGLAWFIGVGKVIGNSVVVDEMLEVSGGVFGAGFDPNQIVSTPVGGMSLVFPDCSATSNPGQLAFSPVPGSGYEILLQNASRLTAIVNCDGSLTSSDAHRSGGFFDTTRSGEGIFVQWLSDNRVLLVFYTFDTDGNAFWVINDIGNTVVSGTTVTAPMVYAEATTRFGTAFDSSEIGFVPWGDVTLGYTDDDNLLFSYASVVAGFGTGSLNYTRLSQPIGTRR